MNEEWREIQGFDPRYQACANGDIRTFVKVKCACCGHVKVKSRLLKQSVNKYGYKYVTLKTKDRIKSVLSHRVIASTFIPNLENKPQVNHINGDKCDNRVHNLEWCTTFENMHHAYSAGLIPDNKVKVVQVDIDTGARIAEFNSIKEAANVVRVHPTGITKVINGAKKTAAGYKWIRVKPLNK